MLLFAALVWGFGWLMAEFSEVSVPLGIAFLPPTALLSPLAHRLKQWNWPPLLAAAACLLLMALLIVGIGWGIGVNAARQAPELADQAVAGFNQFMQWVANGPLAIDQAQLDRWMQSLHRLGQRVASRTRRGTWPRSARPSGAFAGVAIALIATFFFLAEGQHHLWQSAQRMPRRYQQPTNKAVERGWI